MIEDGQLIDENSKIEIRADIEDTAKIKVEEISKESEDYNQMKNTLTNYDILHSYNIYIVNGKYSNDITVTIPLNENMNNKMVKIIHQK